MKSERCAWSSGEPMETYHDEEWGRPERDPRRLFECLVLEGAQAGLSWRSVLVRRDGYREAFHRFDAVAVAQMTDDELEEVLRTGSVIRNRAKVFGARQSARAWLELGNPGGFLWDFVGGKPVQNSFAQLNELPGFTEASTFMSKELKARGFTFCGPTICYAFMQAVGMVNDHLVACPCHSSCRDLATNPLRGV